jgi:hypothetical protein
MLANELHSLSLRRVSSMVCITANLAGDVSDGSKAGHRPPIALFPLMGQEAAHL